MKSAELDRLRGPGCTSRLSAASLAPVGDHRCLCLQPCPLLSYPHPSAKRELPPVEYISANVAGRVPRFFLLALGGAWLPAPPIDLLLVAILVISMPVLGALWASRRHRQGQWTVGGCGVECAGHPARGASLYAGEGLHWTLSPVPGCLTALASRAVPVSGPNSHVASALTTSQPITIMKTGEKPNRSVRTSWSAVR